MRIIFLFYINRSGSTLLAHEFSKYDSILVCPEADVLVDLLIKNKNILSKKNFHNILSRIFIRDPKLKFWDLKLEDIGNLNGVNDGFSIFLRILEKYKEKIKPKASVILFKSDTLYKYVSLIPPKYWSIYEIKVILMLRDGRAVYFSQKSTRDSVARKIMINNPLSSSFEWRKWVRFVEEKKMDDNYFICQYEFFVRQYPQYFDKLMERLGLLGKVGKKSNHGDLFSRLPVEQKNMHQNIIKPPIIEKIDKWKHNLSKDHIYLYEKITGKELLNSGYELENLTVRGNLIYFLKRIVFLLRHIKRLLLRFFRQNLRKNYY